jgi:hypothetical protein
MNNIRMNLIELVCVWGGGRGVRLALSASG